MRVRRTKELWTRESKHSIVQDYRMPGRHLILTACLPPNPENVRRGRTEGLRPPNISNAGGGGFLRVISLS